MEQKGRQQSIQAKLLYEMKEGIYRDADRLPSEYILAERLSISRTQLRDHLARLEREGIITRQHGVGTTINHHVLVPKVRIDLEMEFMEMIRQSGYTPELAFVKVKKIKADENVRSKLQMNGDDKDALYVSRLVTADGKPAIYCGDYIPCSLVKDASYKTDDLRKPIFDFLNRFCDEEAYIDLAEVSPKAADDALAKVFGVPEGTPLLYMDETDYNIGGAPVLYSRQYYVDGIIKHTLMRKKF